MPAETHSYRDPLEVSNVIELLWAVLGGPGDPPAVGASLSDLGIDTDLELLDLFDAAGEEFGERTLADIEVEDLQALRTIGDLAEAIIVWAKTTDGLDIP
jgi:hypothetical protein